MFGESRVHARQYCRIEQIGCLTFLAAFQHGKRLQRRVAVHFVARTVHQQWLKSIPDSGFPIDEGAVAIKREYFEIGQSAIHRSSPLRAVFKKVRKSLTGQLDGRLLGTTDFCARPAVKTRLSDS